MDLCHYLLLKYKKYINIDILRLRGQRTCQQDKKMEKESTLKTIPLGRIGEAKDIASAAFFITQSKYMTGQVIKVDGGRSLS